MILIKHIDEISRQLQRDVLFIEFHPQTRNEKLSYNYNDDPNRIEIIHWLESQGISWEMCGPMENKQKQERYRGTIFVDVEIDSTQKKYQQLLDFMENESGKCKYLGVRFLALKYSLAVENTYSTLKRNI